MNDPAVPPLPVRARRTRPARAPVGTGFRHLLRRVLSDWQLVTGLSLLAFFVAVALAATLWRGSGVTTLPENFAWATSLSPPGPSAAHPFGTLGGIGVDLLVGLAQATPVDLLLVGGAILVALTIGVLLGAYGGFSRGIGDYVVTATGDILVGVPPFFFVLVLFLGVQPFLPAQYVLTSFGLLFAAVLWPYYARPVRARAKLVSQEPYVEAARAAGARDGQLLTRHVIPNSFYPVLAQVPVDVYNIFFVLTVFQFLGCFGGGGNRFFLTLTPLPGPTFPEWGYLLSLGACYGWSILPGLNHWWMYTFPALTILLFGIAVTLTCDGVERLTRPFRAGG